MPTSNFYLSTTTTTKYYNHDIVFFSIAIARKKIKDISSIYNFKKSFMELVTSMFQKESACFHFPIF